MVRPRRKTITLRWAGPRCIVRPPRPWPKPGPSAGFSISAELHESRRAMPNSFDLAGRACRPPPTSFGRLAGAGERATAEKARVWLVSCPAQRAPWATARRAATASPAFVPTSNDNPGDRAPDRPEHAGGPGRSGAAPSLMGCSCRPGKLVAAHRPRIFRPARAGDLGLRAAAAQGGQPHRRFRQDAAGRFRGALAVNATTASAAS